MHCNKVSFQELLHCFDNDLGNNLENNADHLEHNAEKLQEILNRIMQTIMSIITSALHRANYPPICFFTSYKNLSWSIWTMNINTYTMCKHAHAMHIMLHRGQ